MSALPLPRAVLAHLCADTRTRVPMCPQPGHVQGQPCEHLPATSSEHPAMWKYPEQTCPRGAGKTSPYGLLEEGGLGRGWGDRVWSHWQGFLEPRA